VAKHCPYIDKPCIAWRCISFEHNKKPTNTWRVLNKKTLVVETYHWNPHADRDPPKGLSESGLKNFNDSVKDYKDNYVVEEIFDNYGFCHAMKKRIDNDYL